MNILYSFNRIYLFFKLFFPIINAFNMNYLSKFKSKLVNYLFDHPVLKTISKHSYMVLITALSSLFFVIGFEAFVQPSQIAAQSWANLNEGNYVVVQIMASVGASGLSQALIRILELIGWKWLLDSTNSNLLFWILYFVFNIPLFILGFLKIGKKFTFYTLLNVGFVSLFGAIIPKGSPNDFINEMAVLLFDQPISRIVLAGLCTGLSSALAYSIESSTGGIDILAFYFSEKKSIQIGWVSLCYNAIVLVFYCGISCFHGGLIDVAVPMSETLSGVNGTNIMPPLNGSYVAYANLVNVAIIMCLYTCLYMVISSIVVNTINVSNKKECVQVITTNYNLSQVILANIPHGCTIIEGKGGYSGEKKYLIYMTVRKNEVKKVVRVCKKADLNCFINIYTMDQVYGKFYRKPIE